VVDKVTLNKDEVFMFDTATNIITFGLVFGAIEVLNSDNNVLALLNDNYDIFTIPANTGIVKIRGISDYSGVYIFRSFYI
jgi:hypothetical protein